LPLSIVEIKYFRHFLSVVDSRYTLPARATVASQLEKKVTLVKEKLKQDLVETNTVNTTVDIWSDRKMRGYMATTVHYVKRGECALKSGLLMIERFTGSHTGERIAAAFDAAIDGYDIRHKIDHIVTDNAANMRKAFTTCFPITGDDHVRDDDDSEGTVEVDDPESWEALPANELISVVSVMEAGSRGERLSCFCHSLHLTVSDGLKDTKCVSSAIAKACKLASLLHQSQIFRDEFENEFGKNSGIPTAVCTRWNSTLRQLRAIVSLDQKKLTSVLETRGHKNIILTAREHGQLSELCDILDPFLEATNIAQGDKCVSISSVLPAVLSLHSHLQDFIRRVKYCKPVVEVLSASLKKRFAGLFIRATPPNLRLTHVTDDKFGSDIYVIAAVLDPSFRMHWLDVDVTGSSTDKEHLRREVTGYLLFFTAKADAVASVKLVLFVSVFFRT